MQIILLDSGDMLPPLTDRLPKVLLPICGKSLAILWLDLLCNIKVTEVTIVSKNHERIESHLGNGNRWGMQLHYVESFETPAEAALWFDLGQLCDVEIANLFMALENQEAITCIESETGKFPVAIYTPEGKASRSENTFEGLLAQTKQSITINGQCIKIDSFSAFHQANLSLLQGNYQYLAPSGRLVLERLYLNNMSTYSDDSLCSGFLYLGERCKLHKSTVLQSNVVIGDRVIVDKESKIIHSLILPDTYVGRFTEVSNAIVWGNILIKLDGDVVLEVEDDFILGNLKQVKNELGLLNEDVHECRIEMNKMTGLINTYSTYNIGDSAIYSAIARLAPEQPVYGTIQDKSPLFTPGFSPVPQLDACDVYVSVGGDIFNNARPSLVTRNFLANVSMLKSHPRQTMLFGQSIPASCRGIGFWWLCQALKNIAAVVVRDAKSHQRLLDAGVQARLSYDFAFGLKASAEGEALARHTYEALALNADKVVLISLRQFDQMYPHDNEVFIEKLSTLCTLLAQEGLQPTLLVQSDAYGTDGDWAVAKRIQSNVDVPIVNAFANHESIANWNHLMGLLAQAYAVVGVRYHTSILRLVAGRVPYNLFYSIKGEDLSTRLGVPGGSVANFDPHQALPEILATADQTFDIAPIAQQVQEDFDWAYGRALGQQ